MVADPLLGGQTREPHTYVPQLTSPAKAGGQRQWYLSGPSGTHVPPFWQGWTSQGPSGEMPVNDQALSTSMGSKRATYQDPVPSFPPWSIRKPASAPAAEEQHTQRKSWLWLMTTHRGQPGGSQLLVRILGTQCHLPMAAGKARRSSGWS